MAENTISKEDFLRPMYRHDDSSDDDLDSFADFRKKNSQEAVHTTNGVSNRNDQVLTTPDLASSTSVDLYKLPLCSYITSLEQGNKMFKSIKPKDHCKIARMQKLKNKVLFYWPADANPGPSKTRQYAYGPVLANGAILARKWDNGEHVTHIVVDSTGKGREYHDVLKDLKVEEIPDGIQLVKSAWVDAVLSARPGMLPASSEHLYRLVGQTKSSDPPSRESGPASSKRAASDDARGSEKNKKPRIETTEHRALEIDSMNESGSAKAMSKNDNGSQLLKQNRRPDPSVVLALNARRGGFAIPRSNTILQQKIDIRELEQEKFDALDRIMRETKNASDATTENGDHIDMIDKAKWDDIEDVLLDEVDHTESQPTIVSRTAKGFLCAKKNIKGSNEGGPNADLIEHLKQLADFYSSKSTSNDPYRAKGYRIAVSVIEKQTQQIKTADDARNLSGIGTSIAQKIEEFITTGKIGKLQEFTTDPKEQAIKLFTGIFGVGTTIAQNWANKGLRTLADLEAVELLKNQKIGLEHYEDFNSRIPRNEITQHVEFVIKMASTISPHLAITVGGSYRRGQADSGDIDFLITAPDSVISATHLQMLVYDQLIPKLREIDYIKADLTTPADTRDNSKWLGAACLPNASPQIWRRVDMLVVPNAEWGAALLYFTGNEIFNRSMRLLARRAGGTLNQHGLYKNVIRDKEGFKLSAGQLIEGRDEKKIFEALGVKWRPPHERCP